MRKDLVRGAGHSGLQNLMGEERRKMRKIATKELRYMEGREGLILQGCGGPLDEWVDGINQLLTEESILLNGSKFEDVSIFQQDGLICLLR